MPLRMTAGATRQPTTICTQVKTMMTTIPLWQRLSRLMLSLGVLVASGAAWAVNDLPGGPAVRQFDLHPPASKIAEQQDSG